MIQISSGTIAVNEIFENTEINVDAEIVGKKLIKQVQVLIYLNGMKLKFLGNVTPLKNMLMVNGMLKVLAIKYNL